MIRHARTEAELACLEAAPEAVLDDLGVSREQVSLLRSERDGALWRRMALRADAPPTRIAGDLALLREVATGCALCGERGRCRRWLDRAGALPGEHRAFCPNAAIFDRLASSRRNRPHRFDDTDARQVRPAPAASWIDYMVPIRL